MEYDGFAGDDIAEILAEDLGMADQMNSVMLPPSGPRWKRGVGKVLIWFGMVAGRVVGSIFLPSISWMSGKIARTINVGRAWAPPARRIYRLPKDFTQAALLEQRGAWSRDHRPREVFQFSEHGSTSNKLGSLLYGERQVIEQLDKDLQKRFFATKSGPSERLETLRILQAEQRSRTKAQPGAEPGGVTS